MLLVLLLSNTLGVTGATTLTGGVTGGLNVTGNTKITGDANITGNLTGGNISLTKVYSNTSSATNAELSSDTTNWKSLMILGNTSAGGGRNISMWDNVKINGNTTIGGSLKIGSITLSEVNGQLFIDKPIFNDYGVLRSPKISNSILSGNQQWILGGNGSQSDSMFEFRDSNTNARKAWLGWTWGTNGSGYN